MLVTGIAACLLAWLTAAAAAGDLWTEAIAHRDAAALGRLVADTTDVNRATEGGDTALMIAAGARADGLVRALIERDADVNASNGRGGTALMYAAAAGDEETVAILLRHGAAIDARAANGWTALTLAVARGFERVVADLLAQGADPNVADIYGWTPLMRAIDLDRPGVVRVLLASPRTRLDVRNDSGHTALHYAAARGAARLVRFLIERGADVGVRDRGGRTPAAVARMQGHRAVAEMITKSAGRGVVERRINR